MTEISDVKTCAVCGSDFQQKENEAQWDRRKYCSKKCRSNSVMAKPEEYRIWKQMKSRCYNKNMPAYQDYGERGIFVCPRWKDSYENFIKDMGPRPSKEYSIERIDNNKGYSPDNCKWATRKEQARNYRRNIFITYKNETKVLKDWCDGLGLRYGMVCQRIVKYGWSPEKAFTTPSRIRRFQ